MKVYSFKLNEEIPEESDIINLLESWRESGGTVKSFLLERIPGIPQDSSKYLSKEEWQREKAILRSLYSLFDQTMVDVEKLKEELEGLKPKPYNMTDVPKELQ